MRGYLAQGVPLGSKAQGEPRKADGQTRPSLSNRGRGSVRMLNEILVTILSKLFYLFKLALSFRLLSYWLLSGTLAVALLAGGPVAPGQPAVAGGSARLRASPRLGGRRSTGRGCGGPSALARAPCSAAAMCCAAAAVLTSTSACTFARGRGPRGRARPRRRLQLRTAAVVVVLTAEERE